MQNIETGYKPEFGLGAWFAGQNAANTEAANEEELIKNFLSNQQSLQMNPLLIQKQGYDNDVASYNAQEALAKQNDKAYIPAMLQGAKDQQATIGFDMQKKRDTLQGDVGATNAKNAVSATQDTLLNNFRKAQEVGDTKTANSILEMLIQDPAYQQKLRAQAAQDAAAMARQDAGDTAAMNRLKEQERIRSAEEDRRLKEKGPEKLNLEQAAVQDIQRRILIGEITPQQGTLEYAALIAGKQKVNPNPGMVLGRDAEGNIVMDQGSTIPTWQPNVQQTAGDPVQAALKKAGIAYEPDKYEYRVTGDGQVQRKAKK